MRTLLTVLCLCLFGAPLARAETVEADVTWDATGKPGFVKIHGDGGKATGKFDKAGELVSGWVECDAAGFTTGNSLRDEHMRDKYLEVAKHPKFRLTIDPVKPAAADFPWTGKLTIKGATHDVTGTARVEGKALWAKFNVAITDYPEIGVPSWLGVTVAKDVEVSVRGTVAP